METARVVVLAALLVLVGSARAPTPVARAHESSVADGPQDEPVPLDIRAGTVSHVRDFWGRTVLFTLETYEPFSNAQLQQPQGEDYAVAIGISIDSDEAFERLCFVHVQEDDADGDGLSPFAVVTEGRRMPEADFNTFSVRERFAGYAVVRRPSDDSIEVAIPARLVARRGEERFRWRARMVSSPEPNSIHYDYVPDEGLARGHTKE